MTMQQPPHRNGHPAAGRGPLDLPGGNVPILHVPPANVQKWRCASGHEFTASDGAQPGVTLSWAAVVGQQAMPVAAQTMPGTCVLCVMEWIKAQFPLTLVEVEVEDSSGSSSSPKE